MRSRMLNYFHNYRFNGRILGCRAGIARDQELCLNAMSHQQEM